MTKMLGPLNNSPIDSNSSLELFTIRFILMLLFSYFLKLRYRTLSKMEMKPRKTIWRPAVKLRDTERELRGCDGNFYVSDTRLLQ